MPAGLIEMADKTRHMLSEALTALANEDADLGRCSPATIRRNHGRAKSSPGATRRFPRMSNPRTPSLMCCRWRAVLRVADPAISIAEDVIFR